MRHALHLHDLHWPRVEHQFSHRLTLLPSLRADILDAHGRRSLPKSTRFGSEHDKQVEHSHSAQFECMKLMSQKEEHPRSDTPSALGMQFSVFGERSMGFPLYYVCALRDVRAPRCTTRCVVSRAIAVSLAVTFTSFGRPPLSHLLRRVNGYNVLSTELRQPGRRTQYRKAV